jgi:hypothetical protein
MRLKLAFASLLVLSACGTSPDALKALELMQFHENSAEPGFSYSKLSGSGNDVKLEGVSFLSSPFMAMMMGMEAPEGEEASYEADEAVALLTAESVVLNGLTMKDGMPLVRDMVLNGVSPVGDMGGATITIGSLGIEGLDEKTGAFIASVFTEAGPAEMPAFEEWAFGKAGVNNIVIKGSVDGETGPTTFDVKVGELSVSDLDDTIMGLVRIAGIAGEVNVPTEMMPIAAKFDLGTLDISTLQTDVFTRPFAMVMEGAMDPTATPDYASLYEGYTSPLEPGYDGLNWSGMKIDVSGLKLDTTAFQHKLTRNPEGVVIGSEMPLSKIKLTADAAGGMVGAMGLMVLAMGGYQSDSIELYTAGNAAFDPEKDVTRLSGYNLGVTGVADMKLEMGIIGLQAALPGLMASLQNASDTLGEMATPELDEDGNPIESDEDMSGASTAMAMQMMFALMPLQISDIDLTITDETLMELILNQQAVGAGQSLEEFRGELVGMVQGASAFMTEAGIDPALANELTAATAGFLAGPGTLRLQLKPKQPLGIMSAMSTPMTKENLGFSATFVPAAPEAPEAAPPTN